MACRLRKFRKRTKYPHKRSEGLRRCLRLERLFAAGVAQMAERAIRNREVEGSIPSPGSFVITIL